MYNLLVSANDQEWRGKPFMLGEDRCVHEYTNEEIIEKFGDLQRSAIDSIKRFPCIFAYETPCNKNPKFGLISEIEKRNRIVKISYQIIELDKFLTHSELLQMAFELDISEWEMNRTHWAIKNINLPRELGLKGVKLPEGIVRDSAAVDITKHKFDVALSFPGEIRKYVEPIVIELEREIGPNSYFYDKNYLAQLARPSLDTLLQDIYSKRSKLIVVFLCKAYQKKKWCGVEFRAIKEIIMKRRNKKIMFIKMDDGNVEGVFKTDGYINGRSYNSKELAKFIKERVDLLNLKKNK